MLKSLYQPWLDVYQNLEVYEQREYVRLLSFSVSVIGCFAFLLWTAYSLQLPTLIVLNLMSILVFLYICTLILKTQFKTAVLLITVIILVSIIIHTGVFGSKSGFHMLIWPLACLFATNSTVKVSTGQNFTVLAFVTFISLQYFIPATTEVSFYSNSLLFFLFVGGTILVVAMTSMSKSLSTRRNKLVRLANRDNLTDLYNRRFFSSFLSYQLEVALREKRSFTLAMADIDHFKSINDKHGHDKGDEVLKAVANCFKLYLAQHDAACRWGGEEFLIYLPESKVENAERVVEAIASVISTTTIGDLAITMSFGLVESDGNETLDEILQRVDALMYQAKSQGRDNIQSKLL